MQTDSLGETDIVSQSVNRFAKRCLQRIDARHNKQNFEESGISVLLFSAAVRRLTAEKPSEKPAGASVLRRFANRIYAVRYVGLSVSYTGKVIH